MHNSEKPVRPANGAHPLTKAQLEAFKALHRALDNVQDEAGKRLLRKYGRVPVVPSMTPEGVDHKGRRVFRLHNGMVVKV